MLRRGSAIGSLSPFAILRVHALSCLSDLGRTSENAQPPIVLSSWEAVAGGSTLAVPETTQQPMNPVIQGLLIGFFGSALYFAVDKYESNRTVVFTLKFLVAISGAAVLLHETGLFGHEYFRHGCHA